MKLFIFCAIVTTVTCMTTHRTSSSVFMIDQVKLNGYKIEQYQIQTKDGYVLQMFRMPPKEEQRSVNNSPAVLLMPGMMSSSEDFIAGGPSQGLAYKLVDEGYDVYLGNVRGSSYGQEHARLNPQRDVAFWRFCWQTIATTDLPAIINEVMRLNKNEKISYVGHMEGATSFFVMAAENSKIGEKIETMAALGPVAYLEHSNNDILRKIKNNMDSKKWMMQNVGMSIFKPSLGLISDSVAQCLNQHIDEKICNNKYFIYKGWNSKNLNITTMDKVLSRVPVGGSARSMIHFAQLMETSDFKQMKDFSRDDFTESYNLENISAKIGIFYTPKDSLANVQDITTLKNKLPNVKLTKMYDNLTNNLDLLYSENVDRVNKDVVNFLKEQTD